MFGSRKNLVFIILAGIFITSAITAELIGGKLYATEFKRVALG
jgi:queuosine precursor transporter